VLFDAVYLPGGESSVKSLAGEVKAIEFVDEAYKHCKAIGATGAGIDFLQKTRAGADLPEKTRQSSKIQNSRGVVTSQAADSQRGAAEFAAAFINAIAQHRAWERELPRS